MRASWMLAFTYYFMFMHLRPSSWIQIFSWLSALLYINLCIVVKLMVRWFRSFSCCSRRMPDCWIPRQFFQSWIIFVVFERFLIWQTLVINQTANEVAFKIEKVASLQDERTNLSTPSFSLQHLFILLPTLNSFTRGACLPVPLSSAKSHLPSD